MNRSWIKKLVALLVFLISLFIIDMILNRTNSEITMEMPKATLPVVSVELENHKINTMYGYTTKRQEAYTKDNITPISDKREISLVVDTYQADIKSVAYEVRSIDGERLIEGNEVATLQKSSDQIRFSIQLKDLIEENQEYAFVTILTLEDGEKLYYYNRFIQNEDYFEKEKLDFVLNFHNITFSGGDGSEIKKYLESNSKGDNSSFHNVNIHSSLQQVMWEGLAIEKVQEPQILLKEITKDTASVVLRYLVQETSRTEGNYSFIEEYYRIRYTPNRMYLLDYERTMDEIFDADKNSFTNDKINLGICDENVIMVESEGGKNLAFINANRLFLYNSIDNKLAEVFSFYNKYNFDARTRNRNSAIKILKIEDSGNLAFMVAGYMNRGIHEGKVGVIVYFYNIMQNTVEEQVFIPYAKSPEILIKELENITYLSKENHLYLILDGNLYNIGLEQKSCEILNSNLVEETYKVSESGRMICWLKENRPYESNSLVWMNLSDGKQIEVKAGFGERISILGFMGEDLIYGLVKRADMETKANGNVLFPVYKIVIKNEDEKILKTYEKENCYVINCDIVDNQLTLERVQKNTNGEYEQIEDDHIASNDIQDGNVNRVNTVSMENYGKTVQIILKNTVELSSLKILTPKEVIFEGGREVALAQGDIECYYVYGPKGIEQITTSESQAVNLAYNISGSVVDAEGNYIWKKGTVYTKNQIMAITGKKKDAETSSLAICLDTILELEGISKKTQPLVSMGENAFSILDNVLRERKILNLSGCTLDVVLYYLDQDIPVLAIMENGESYLITGFNEYNVVLMDPGTGIVAKKGMNDSREMFEKNGNQFITYVKNE